jgi:hypothetical protein
MKTSSFRLFLVGLALALAAAPVLIAQAQTPPPHAARHAQDLRRDTLVPPGPGAFRTPDGGWAMHAGQAAGASSPDASAPLATGGPDDYGYTWNDAAPYHWIDATSGTDTLLVNDGSGDPSVTDPQLGFDFKFYQNTHSYVWISSAGAVGFDHSSLTDWQTGYVPNLGEFSPVDFIAPYYDHKLSVGVGNNGRVYYLSGGTAPNRWFVAEWYQVNDGYNTLTFEVVLNETGGIDFNYQNMNQPSVYACGTTAGIENETGWDGLVYRQYGCNQMTASTGHTVRFTRPAESAKVSVFPKKSGAFGYPALQAAFNEAIINNGDLGTDTYEFSTTSSWPVTLYESDGVTPLANIDTGPVDQYATKYIVVKVSVPADAATGQSYVVQLTVSSALNSSQKKVIPMTIAMPAPFVQAIDTADGQRTKFIRQWGEVATHAASGYGGYADTVTTTPGGNVVQVWAESRTNSNGHNVEEVYYVVYDRFGTVIRPATRVTNNDAATTDAYDFAPSVAAAPDGSISIVWRRDLYDQSNSNDNYNIYQLVLDNSGTQVAFNNLTNSSVWGQVNDPNNPRFYLPRVVATQNNRFVISWDLHRYYGSAANHRVVCRE